MKDCQTEIEASQEIKADFLTDLLVEASLELEKLKATQPTDPVTGLTLPLPSWPSFYASHIFVQTHGTWGSHSDLKDRLKQTALAHHTFELGMKQIKRDPSWRHEAWAPWYADHMVKGLFPNG